MFCVFEHAMYTECVMIIFARHGQTIFNTQKKFQGISDSLLTDEGVSQAKKLGQFLQDKEISKFILSPLPRAFQTYEIANKDLNLPFTIEPIVTEICYGSWEEVPKETLYSLKEWKKRKIDSYNFIHPGSFKNVPGESYSILYSRIKPYLDNIVRSKESICIISHLGVMRCVYKYFNNLNDIETGFLKISNNKVYVMDENIHYEKEL